MPHKHKFDALIGLLNMYHGESEKCADASAFLGACVLLASTLEGGLLAMCYCYPEEVSGWVAGLHRRERPRGAPDAWDLGTLISLARDMKWLPAESPHPPETIGDWVEYLREIRNFVHPGKVLRDYGALRVEEGHLRDCEAIFEEAADWLVNKLLKDIEKAVRDKGLPSPRY